MKGLSFGLLALVGCAASVHAVAAPPAPDELGAVVRGLVVDLLHDGGARVDMVLVAADSASAVLLRLADLPAVAAPGPEGLTCPGSTNADGQRTVAPVGYVLQVALATAADTATRELRVTKSCGFRYRGRSRRFAEGGAWALGRDGGHWRVAATLYYWST